MSDLLFANHSTGLHLQLPEKTVDINFIDIEEVQVFATDSNHSALMLKLKPKISAQLTHLTENLVGQPVVWIWNGRVLSMEKLQEPISKDVSIFNFTPQEAEEISKNVR